MPTTEPSQEAVEAGARAVRDARHNGSDDPRAWTLEGIAEIVLYAVLPLLDEGREIGKHAPVTDRMGREHCRRCIGQGWPCDAVLLRAERDEAVRLLERRVSVPNHPAVPGYGVFCASCEWHRDARDFLARLSESPTETEK